MNPHDELVAQYEDSLFALLMDTVAESEGEKALLERERLNSDPAAEVPPGSTRKALRLIRTYFFKKDARRIARASAKRLGQIAAAAGIAVLLFSAAFAASEKIRLKTLNMAAEFFEDHADLSFPLVPAGSTPLVEAGWLPDGYTLLDKGSTEVSSWAFYQFDEEIIGIAFEKVEGLGLSVDTEDAKTELIHINGRQSMLISKGNDRQVITFIAEMQGALSVVGSNISEDEIIRVASQVNFGS